jgi:hypothetical protein
VVNREEVDRSLPTTLRCPRRTRKTVAGSLRRSSKLLAADDAVARGGGDA